MFDVTVIGGGAYGVLSALQIHKSSPKLTIALFEKRKQILVNAAASDRFRFGGKVYTKDQLLEQVQNSDIQSYKSSEVLSLERSQPLSQGKNTFWVKTRRGTYSSGNLIVACGQENSFLQLLGSMGFDIQAYQPAACDLICNDRRLQGVKIGELEVSLSWVKPGPPRKRVKIQLASALPESHPLKQVNGSISISSGRMSGIAVMELTGYILNVEETPMKRMRICVNWLPDYGFHGLLEYLQTVGRVESKKTVMRSKIFSLPATLWRTLAAAAEIAKETRWDEMTSDQYFQFTSQLHNAQFNMRPDLSARGIPYSKGGVMATNLRSDRPESLKYPGLFFVGSILDQDPQFGKDPILELTKPSIFWLSEIGKDF